MTLKTLLVHVEDTPAGKARLEAAIALASEKDAHLAGLGIRPPEPIPAYGAAVMPQQLVRDISKEYDEHMSALRKHFEEKLRQAGREASSEWRAVTGEPEDSVSLHGRYSDLIVLGPIGLKQVPDAFRDLAESVILESGRPVLVVPEAGTSKPIGKNILVAWDGSREAARAVADSLPFLRESDKVTLLSVNVEKAHELPGASISAHLDRHGINVEMDSQTSQKATGDTIIEQARKRDCDMIVTGAYGHARWRQIVLGGVTNTLLRRSPLPVFMSH